MLHPVILEIHRPSFYFEISSWYKIQVHADTKTSPRNSPVPITQIQRSVGLGLPAIFSWQAWGSGRSGGSAAGAVEERGGSQQGQKQEEAGLEDSVSCQRPGHSLEFKTSKPRNVSQNPPASAVVLAAGCHHCSAPHPRRLRPSAKRWQPSVSCGPTVRRRQSPRLRRWPAGRGRAGDPGTGPTPGPAPLPLGLSCVLGSGRDFVSSWPK